MRTKLSTKGQIILPAELRQQDRIRSGQQFDVERLEHGRYLLTKQTAPGRGGILDWLRACPERGWFRPLRSESTDKI